MLQCGVTEWRKMGLDRYDGMAQIDGMTDKMKVQFLAAPIESFDGWSRLCSVNGTQYHVSVRRGRSVRIPFKPRGKNRGWKWNGTVYSGGKCVWSGEVPGSIGASGLIAKVIR
jgi:hypothetical protein